MVWPAFRVDDKVYSLDIMSDVLQFGFIHESLVPSDICKQCHFKADEVAVYSRPDQRVIREIRRFRKK